MSCFTLFFSLCLPITYPPVKFDKPSIGLAARYGYKGDRFETWNQPFACSAILKKRWGYKRYQAGVKIGVSHRTLPCGTKILICRLPTKSPIPNYNVPRGTTCTPAVVVDRGPYGALDPQGHWHRRSRLRPGERWRGIVDLLPPVAAKLGVRGLEQVVIWY